VNAAILAAKVAAVEDLKQHTLPLSDFVWMMPPDKAQLYTQYGIEGLSALWKDDTRSFLCSGGVVRLYELIQGPPLRPRKPDSSAINQLLAHRLFGHLVQERDSLLQEATAAEAKLVVENRVLGTAKPKQTIWQRAGVHRGETELEIAARVRVTELDAVRSSIGILSSHAPYQPLQMLQSYISVLNVGVAGVLGMLYGGARGYSRAWLSDVTPSVCRELATHVSKRTALGAMLLVGFFEAAPMLKKSALTAAGQSEVTDFKSPGALQQLVAIDMSYLGVIALVNMLFPYVLVPVAFNPAQLLVLPAEGEASHRKV